jgi:hypothetical protein
MRFSLVSFFGGKLAAAPFGTFATISALSRHDQIPRRLPLVGVKRTSLLYRGKQLDEVVLAADGGYLGGALSPGRYSLTLGISQRRGHCRINSPRSVVERIGTTERILSSAIVERFTMTSSRALGAGRGQHQAGRNYGHPCRARDGREV